MSLLILPYSEGRSLGAMLDGWLKLKSPGNFQMLPLKIVGSFFYRSNAVGRDEPKWEDRRLLDQVYQGFKTNLFNFNWLSSIAPSDLPSKYGKNKRDVAILVYDLLFIFGQHPECFWDVWVTGQNAARLLPGFCVITLNCSAWSPPELARLETFWSD
ncbi:hypothetical protein BYT27DRAFT_7206965 [Phlegmacium glaucopus]|nr:hypothetical protein BYT27DRAFT_7206965 [Phlegmacium glaucopus]